MCDNSCARKLAQGRTGLAMTARLGKDKHGAAFGTFERKEMFWGGFFLLDWVLVLVFFKK